MCDLSSLKTIRIFVYCIYRICQTNWDCIFAQVGCHVLFFYYLFIIFFFWYSAISVSIYIVGGGGRKGGLCSPRCEMASRQARKGDIFQPIRFQQSLSLSLMRERKRERQRHGWDIQTFASISLFLWFPVLNAKTQPMMGNEKERENKSNTWQSFLSLSLAWLVGNRIRVKRECLLDKGIN